MLNSILWPTEVLDKFSGIRVPFHVQEFLNGGLVLDILISNVTVNPGLRDTDFGIS